MNNIVAKCPRYLRCFYLFSQEHVDIKLASVSILQMFFHTKFLPFYFVKDYADLLQIDCMIKKTSAVKQTRDQTSQAFSRGIVKMLRLLEVFLKYYH